MTRLLDIIPSWLWATALAASLLGGTAAAGYQYVLLSAERAAHSKSKADHATEVANSKQAALDQSEAFRKKEQELRDAQVAHTAVVLALQADLDRAHRAAERASAGVQHAADAAAAEARRRCTAATLVDLREAAGDPIGVLADVLGRADRRAGILADLADRRGLAGRSCEREYDTLYRALTQ